MGKSVTSWRNSSQPLMPVRVEPTPPGQYDIYPGFPTGSGQIEVGFDALAERVAAHSTVIIDGFIGVFWSDLRARLDKALKKLGVEAAWIDVARMLKSETEIEALVNPFLGGDDPIFGTRFTGDLGDFFDSEGLAAAEPDLSSDCTILYGCGAALAGWEGFLVYVDLPKSELQYRSRAGTVMNLGAAKPTTPKLMYKRFYFVDWPVLTDYKADLLLDIDLMVDGQRPTEPTLMAGDVMRSALATMAHNYIRVRPWFEPGPWGGHWIKGHIPQLPQDVPNYAWSFELITPENGLLLESDGSLLEIAFDWLMIAHNHEVIGDAAARFGTEFPIRFNFLDTIDGGNLSLQCHPRLAFIREQFGERFTQDETYYILDCTPGARVYLGFQTGVNPADFHAVLTQSAETGVSVDIERYVKSLPAHKHDLYLIPSGTIHCSGTGNMVLEISATPYLFTFKMYDWLRLDLEGKLRPLNIERAFDNLCFERQGERVEQELVSHPYVEAEGVDWQRIHLPTHHEHFYDVRRYEFDSTITAETNGSAHIMSLVEGGHVLLETKNGMRQRFNYAETFIVPAAAASYRLINETSERVKVLVAHMKTPAVGS